MDPKNQDTATTIASTTTTAPACADIWSASKCKEKKKAGECNTSCTTDDCVKTQAKCKKKCKICQAKHEPFYNVAIFRYKQKRNRNKYNFFVMFTSSFALGTIQDLSQHVFMY